MALSPEQLVNGASGALFLALGIFVATIRPASGARIPFAIFLVAFGTRFMLNNWTGDTLARLGVEPIVELVIAGSLVSVWFVPSFIGDRLRARTHLVPALLAAAHLGLQARAVRADGDTLLEVAWIFWISVFWFGILVLAGLYRRDARAGDDAAARRWTILTLGLALQPVFAPGTTFADGFWWDTKGTGLGFGTLVWLDLLFAPLVGCIWVWNGLRAPGGVDRRARNVGLGILALGLAGALVGAFLPAITEYGTQGITRTLAVLVLTYGVLRHSMLGVDVKLRFAISKSTIAAVFIAVFFFASEAAQQFFGETLGSTYVGIAAAGALVFALAPLQRAAERLAERAVPIAATAAPTATSGGRADLYRRAVRFAYRDGRVSPEEELHLFEVAEALGLGAGEAMRVRQDVEREAGRPSSTGK